MKKTVCIICLVLPLTALPSKADAFWWWGVRGPLPRIIGLGAHATKAKKLNKAGKVGLAIAATAAALPTLGTLATGQRGLISHANANPYKPVPAPNPFMRSNRIDLGDSERMW